MSWQALVAQEREWAALVSEAEAIAHGHSDQRPTRAHLVAALRFGSAPDASRNEPDWDGTGDPF